ncbi:DUF4435 domain-containing protein [Streptomyces anthocyanicus]|uniref:DUF4435 domain-containing protein n=1 Tax=Streptomyces anthocyanicus TaxID=68174 RepID=UPI002DD79FA6|nr:DUF4435 domain-containing protein [Streptomyces anthocyanicus]WSB62097.1 DUF4435 domain-containing protein [Streptomyces anthocyanicus]
MNRDERIPRRRIEELVALYEFEPEIVDLFVEGRSDRVLFEHLLDDAGEHVRVWEVDDIDIPAEMVASVGEFVGAKGRVVALAAELEQRLADDGTYSVLCIVDADFDHIIRPEVKASKFLAATDFSCLESYYWNPKTVRKYLGLSLHGSVPLKHDQFMSEVENVVSEVFLLRLATASLKLNFSWVDPASCCGDPRKKGGIRFSDYFEKIINKNKAHERKGDLERRVEKYRELKAGDMRHLIHGHDLCKVISWLIRPYIRDRSITSEEVISRSLACCADRGDLAHHPLFTRILALAGNSP